MNRGKWYLEYTHDSGFLTVRTKYVALDAKTEDEAISEARRRWPEIQRESKGWKPHVIYYISDISA